MSKSQILKGLVEMQASHESQARKGIKFPVGYFKNLAEKIQRLEKEVFHTNLLSR